AAPHAPKKPGDSVRNALRDALLAFIVVASPLIEQIPLAALVGVMFMVVIGTFAWNSLMIMRKVPLTDAFVIILVTAVTVMTDLAIAVVVGVIVSALAYAWQNATRLLVMSPTRLSVSKLSISPMAARIPA
ncbi:hypothetical protein N9A56_09805, partial [Planktomarina temperata]|nr:hypothetical protein [Planktomarina temperata]